MAGVASVQVQLSGVTWALPNVRRMSCSIASRVELLPFCIAWWQIRCQTSADSRVEPLAGGVNSISVLSSLLRVVSADSISNLGLIEHDERR